MVSKQEAMAKRLLELSDTLLERNRQLQTALESRIVIEQAKGVLAARHALSLDEAFDHLRRAARSRGMNLHELAARVVASPQTPDEISSRLAAPD